MSINVWIFLLVLSIAPALVAAIQIQLTDWPEIDPLLGTLAPLPVPYESIILAINFTILLGAMGFIAVFIPLTTRFRVQSSLIKFIVFGVMVSLVLIVLWLMINFTFLTIYFDFYHGPTLGWSVMPNWIVVIGWIWTFITVIFMAVYYTQVTKGKETRRKSG